MTQASQYLGVGIYSVGEAAVLTGASLPQIRRWLRGYTYKTDGEAHDRPPVWHRQLPELNGILALGFLDLMEVRFVREFRSAGVKWSIIRKAAERARELLQKDHPFATQSFRTDGYSIFAEVTTEAGEAQLFDMAKDQLAFKGVMKNYLYAGLDFNDEDQAARWWPIGKNRGVVLDPLRSFGRPIVSREGIPTVVLADAYRVEQSYKAVAEWFCVGESAVRSAVDFQRKLAA